MRQLPLAFFVDYRMIYEGVVLQINSGNSQIEILANVLYFGDVGIKLKMTVIGSFLKLIS